MKTRFALTVLAGAFLLAESRAERSLIAAYQPTSLLGTEGESDPLETGEWIAATIVSRPVIIGGAFPESLVHAVSLPHKIAGATDGFPEESNLIVIVGGNVHAEWGQEEDQIIADFSRAKVPENLGVTLIQVMKMTALCLEKLWAIRMRSRSRSSGSLLKAYLSLTRICQPKSKGTKNKPAPGNRPHKPSRHRSVAINIILNRRGAPGSSRKTSSFDN